MNQLTNEQRDDLFDIFNDAQGLQRRVVRIIARGFISEPAVAELKAQAAAILARIEGIGEQA